MLTTIKGLIPEFLKKPWHDLQWRLLQMERRHEETDRILDILVTEEVFQPKTGKEMNGQDGRKEIVHDLFRRIPFVAAIETGTYFGHTTGYLASALHVPVHSCEISPRYHHVARRLLRDLPGIHLHCEDARFFLDNLSRHLPTTSDPVFFYLDAHWYEDLPLVEEVELIAARWQNFVAMIDDFEVPGDPEYGYDSYGGRDLNMELLSPALAGANLQAFFPALPASRETGSKRGCAIIVSPSLIDTVHASPLVRLDVE